MTFDHNTGQGFLGDGETWGLGDGKMGSTCGEDVGEKGSSHLREGDTETW